MKAADKGDMQSQVNVANAYYLGDGVECDHHKAFLWYREAAFQGHVLSQKNVGGSLVFESVSAKNMKNIARMCLDTFPASHPGKRIKNSMLKDFIAIDFEKAHDVENIVLPPNW